MGIAWDYLDDVQKAQLLACRPELQERITCKRCGGQLYEDDDIYGSFMACHQCSATHNMKGELEQRDPIAEGINLYEQDKIMVGVSCGGRHNFNKKQRSRSW